MGKNKKYYSAAQQTAMLVSANTEVVIGSRRSGKSHSRVAPTAIRNAQAMPRSAGGFVASTFKQAHKRTIPAMIVGLEELGFKRDIHFVLGRKPNKSLGFARPYVEPDDWHDVLSWYNGSVLSIISLDISMPANSMTLDYIIGDEARGFNFKKLKEDVLPANGGTQRHFSDCPWHHSTLFCSDMPIGKDGTWLLDYKNRMDPEVIEMIKALMAERYHTIASPDNDWKVRKLREIDSLLFEFRRNAVYYAEWSIFENIDLIGVEYVQKMKRDLPPLIFQTSILCKRLGTLQGGFYPNFSQHLHTYIANNNKPLESTDWCDDDRDWGCQLDSDVVLSEPIAVAFDYNANINWLVAGQVSGKKLQVIKSFFVKYNRKLRELIDDFCQYYRFHKSREVIYYYDATAIGSNYAVNESDFASVVVEQFYKNGWSVQSQYIGTPMRHSDKYLIINDGLKGYKGLIPLLNKENNEALIASIIAADVAITSSGFVKDKGGEKLAESEEDLLEYRTDGSDAFDTLVIGCNKFPYHSALYMGSSC